MCKKHSLYVNLLYEESIVVLFVNELHFSDDALGKKRANGSV